MASEPAGIAALFSMYDDDEEEIDYSFHQSNPPSWNRISSPRSPLQPDESSSDHKTLISPLPPSPSQIRSSLSAQSSSPRLLPVPRSADWSIGRKEAFGIVDYGHDEMAMSPAHYEGERTSAGSVHMFREVMQKTSSPVADSLEKSKPDVSMAVDTTGSDHEMTRAEETGTNTTDVQKDDFLSCFLGPPVTTKCSEKLQQRIDKFVGYKRAGRSFNEEVRNKKDYRNPDFLQHAVRYQDIDQIGTCFSKEVFDPHGYDKSDYYDVIASSALPPAPATGDASRRETRHKKSKWDKVEGDVKNSVLPTGAAAVLSQSTVGGGYSGFAQQKRREAEEKKD